MQTCLRYAVLGTGNIVKEFIAAARGTPLRLGAVCSRSARRGAAFAREIGEPELPVFEGVERLAQAADIDACYVASPNGCHAAQCAALLSAGKHVLCEKPAAAPAALEQLHALARERNLIFAEAIMYLQTPMRRAVLEALPKLGRITSAMIDFSQRSSRYDRYLAGETPNIFNPALAAGAWMDLGVYCIYPALDFFGEPEEAKAIFHTLRTGADGAGAAILRYPDFPVTLTWSKTGQSRGVSQILGDNGTLTLQSISQFQGIALYDREGGARRLDAPLAKPEVMRYEAQAFCDMIRGKPTAVALPEANALSLRVSRWMEKILNG
ncbi:MAG: Gfo/Idh/MocA family oxidoreductase [Oscillospiraceae bacterium]|jgi:predicted dehydrogenase|nr:Gfo/Idh/MocA family oxidoreductase [Oscillospiraceae bacterium]